MKKIDNLSSPPKKTRKKTRFYYDNNQSSKHILTNSTTSTVRSTVWKFPPVSIVIIWEDLEVKTQVYEIRILALKSDKNPGDGMQKCSHLSMFFVPPWLHEKHLKT